jgi:hypothetical protein
MQRSGWLKKLEDLNAKGSTRSLRRLVVVVWLLAPTIFFMTAVIDLCSWHGSGRFYGIASCICCFAAVGLATLNIRLNRRAFSGMSLNDLSQTVFAQPYLELNEMQRDRVKWHSRQEFKKGDLALDEREVVMRFEAERRTFRILRPTVFLLSVVYWVVCLSAPIGQMRVGLLIGAVVFSGFALLVIVLPEVIRSWREPDAAGEPEIAAEKSH